MVIRFGTLARHLGAGQFPSLATTIAACRQLATALCLAKVRLYQANAGAPSPF